MSRLESELFKKYDVPAPRYTSYPTVPYWSDNPTTEQWLEALKDGLKGQDSSWSMYVHIPFCETLCTFCGCNTTITRNHDKESPYAERVLREWQTYLGVVPELRERTLKQLHLGGGTPTFLSAQNLAQLIDALLKNLRRDEAHFEGSLEVDPRRTRQDQLEVLRARGFNRISLGVQDFDPEVQRLINRIQPFEQTRSITEMARSLGYKSVNFDLIYGLPKQTPETMEKAMDATLDLRPDRIAFYSFAKVPWIKPAQRLFKDSDLPEGEDKRELYELGRRRLLAAGYIEIGMDHFALPDEELALSAARGKLHRNFMGYTDQRTDVLLGLGVSSISEAPTCFHQNEKVIAVYERTVDEGKIPTHRGHLLNAEDRERRQQILKFMTTFSVDLLSEQVADAKEFLKPMLEDGLVKLEGSRLSITDKGRPFLRWACMALDARLRRSEPSRKIFSSAI